MPIGLCVSLPVLVANSHGRKGDAAQRRLFEEHGGAVLQVGPHVPVRAGKTDEHTASRSGSQQQGPDKTGPQQGQWTTSQESASSHAPLASAHQAPEHLERGQLHPEAHVAADYPQHLR